MTGLYTAWYAWWYNWTNQSRTWINAHQFYIFTRDQGRGRIVRNFYEMQVGDVLQMDFGRDGFIDHSMVVTGKDRNGVIYLSYHSNNTLNKSINSIVSAYPKAIYYGWRMYSYN